MKGCELTMLLVAGGTSRVPMEGIRGCCITSHTDTTGYNIDLLPIPRYSSSYTVSKSMRINELHLPSAEVIESAGVKIGYSWLQLDVYSGGKAGNSGTVEIQSNGTLISSGFASVTIDPDQRVVVHSGGVLEYGFITSKQTSSGGSFYHHSGMIDADGIRVPTLEIQAGGCGTTLSLDGNETDIKINGTLCKSEINHTYCEIGSGGRCIDCTCALLETRDWHEASSGDAMIRHQGLKIRRGGVVSNLTMGNWGICTVEDGGSISGCHPRYVVSTIDPVSSGVLHISSGGHAENCRDLYCVHVFSGGILVDAESIKNLIIHSGGVVQNLKSNGETVYRTMSYNNAGGVVYKDVNAAHYNTLDGAEYIGISGSGNISIHAAAKDIRISGSATVYSGGTAADIQCDHLIVSSGGTVSGVHIESGTLTVLSGGTALAVDWNKNRALTLEVDSGAKVTYIYE